MVCALLRYCARWCEPALPRVQVIDQPTKGQVACAERSRCDTGCARARARTVRAAREQTAFSSAVRSPCARPALALRRRPAPTPRARAPLLAQDAPCPGNSLHRVRRSSQDAAHVPGHLAPRLAPEGHGESNKLIFASKLMLASKLILASVPGFCSRIRAVYQADMAYQPA